MEASYDQIQSEEKRRLVVNIAFLYKSSRDIIINNSAKLARKEELDQERAHGSVHV